MFTQLALFGQSQNSPQDFRSMGELVLHYHYFLIIEKHFDDQIFVAGIIGNVGETNWQDYIPAVILENKLFSNLFSAFLNDVKKWEMINMSKYKNISFFLYYSH